MSSEKEPVQVEPVAPFHVDMSLYEEDKYVVPNKFTGQTVTLTPTATAVYDIITSAELLATQLTNEHDDMSAISQDMEKLIDGLWETVRKGLDWFREHYAKEYMVILD